MGKKTRIVLLSITVAIAVFTFSMMWIVRPDSQSSVLDAARERQNEPLLQVSEPLETDVQTLSDEEEMAEKVAAILSSDEDFISALSQAIAGRISLDDYIPEITEAVYNRISEDYDEIAAEIASMVDASFEDDVIALYNKYKKDLTADLVLAILDEYDSLSTEEKSDVLELEAQLRELYAKYRDEIVSDLSLEAADGISKEELESMILAFYESHKDMLASELGEALLAEYNSLDAAGKAELLGLYDIFMYYRNAIIADVLSSEEKVDVEAEVTALYAEYKDSIVSDIENAIIEDYSALSGDEKTELLSLESQAVSLYEKYRDAIIADIIAALGSEPEVTAVEPVQEPEPVEEPEVVEVPEPADEPIVREYSYAGYTLTATIDEGNTVLEYPGIVSKDDVIAFFAYENEKYDLSSLGVAYSFSGSDSVRLTYPESYTKESVADELDKLVEDLIEYISAPVETPEPAVVAEPEPEPEPEPVVAPEPAEEVKPSKRAIAAPSFAEGGIIAPDASAEEYEKARTDLRKAEIDKALAFIAE